MTCNAHRTHYAATLEEKRDFTNLDETVHAENELSEQATRTEEESQMTLYRRLLQPEPLVFKERRLRTVNVFKLTMIMHPTACRHSFGYSSGPPQLD